MKNLILALHAEYSKISRSGVLWISLIFFAFTAFMMGLLMFVQIHPEIAGRLGMVGTKASMLRIGNPDWASYFNFLNQAIAAIGMVGYGFVTSWVFGREYSDNTIKDILALPISRSAIVTAKFLAILLWNILLTMTFLFCSLLAGKMSGLTGWTDGDATVFFTTYAYISFLSMLLCTPFAFLACWGRGYLLPIAFIIVALICANFAGLVGLGPYFPWSIPGILSVPPSEDMHLNPASYLIVILTSLAGYAATIFWWRYADHK
jgi:ABC-2 type transport system permease protein